MKNLLLTKAKAGLIIDQPFFASLLLAMPLVEKKEIPTMATDGETIWFNPEWINTLTQSELTFVLAHEVLHGVFLHMFRRGEKNHNKWNVAGDYIINNILVQERVGTMPKGGLHNPSLVKQGNETTEGVYALLPKETEEKGAGDEGGAMDQVLDAAKDQAQTAQKEAEMRVKIIQAKNAAKMQGKLSAGLERLVADLVKPKIDWRAALRNFLSKRAKIDYSFAKPRRRFMTADFILPSLSGQQIGKIAIAVDCSGSVDDKTLATFEAEIQSILETVKPTSIDVLYFDTEIMPGRETFENGEDFKLNARGGGGTAFSPIFKALNTEQDIEACIVLTDLQCNDFGPAPAYPVLWASTMEGKAPFGEVLLIKE